MQDIAGSLWRGHTPGNLILDFTETAIVLRKKDLHGAAQEIGRATLDSPDFTDQIDALRVESLVQDPKRRPVMVWLPEAQVLERLYVLQTASHGAARAEAMRRLQTETGYAAEELSIDLTTVKHGEATVVLSALCQTIREALEYTRRWGFKPGIVSTPRAADCFPQGHADFRLPTPRAYSAGRKFAQAAAVSAVILGGGFAGLKVYEMTEPLLKAMVIKEVPGHMPLPQTPAETRIEVARNSAPIGRPQVPQSLPIQGLRSLTTLQAANAALSTPLNRIARLPVVSLLLPVGDVQVRLGAASHTPSHTRPGRLGNLSPAVLSTGIARVKSAVDRIRSTTRSVAHAASRDAGPKTQRVSRVAFAGATPEIAKPAPQARTGASSLVPNAGSLLQEASDARISASAVDVADTPEAPATPGETRLAVIDPSAAVLPLPRPAVAEVPVAETTPAPETTSSPSKAPQNIDAGVPKPKRAASASLVPQSEPVSPQTDDTRLAAVEAPKPVPRPASLRAAEPVLPKKAKSISAAHTPRRVGSAANEQGLELTETNLVGVIEARNGRRALVRLPDGDFRKVARGDDVNGWRVNSIDRTAMRLTRKGQNRTLLLVTR